MRKWHRICINVILTLIVAAGLGAVLFQQVRWKDSADSQKKAVETARFTPPAFPLPQVEPPAPPEAPDPVVQALVELDLAALQAINPDVTGWIYIPGTNISYPILQGPDNDYYLKHTWERKWNGGGSIFLDCHCSPDFEDYHTVIYGHRMNNSTMFAQLHSYEEQDFLREHPSVYVADASCVRRYDVFSVWEPSVSSPVYTADLSTPEARQEFADLCLSSSQVEAGVVPDPEDKLLTLSTCTGNGHATRWVVQASLFRIYNFPRENPLE